MKDGLKPGQREMTDYFEMDKVCHTIDDNIGIKTKINDIYGQPRGSSVAPLLQRLFDNAQNNTSKSKHANRHDRVVKQFAAALLILTGKSGYELLQSNLGKYHHL